MDLIVSVKEAREFLGKEADGMTDQQIEKLIVDLDEIARLTIKTIVEGTFKTPPEIKKSGKNY